MKENLVVSGSPWTLRDLSNLFGGEDFDMIDDIDLSELAVLVGAYTSRSQARKAGRVGSIPKGWTEWKANKKMRFWIWNPSE